MYSKDNNVLLFSLRGPISRQWFKIDLLFS